MQSSWILWWVSQLQAIPVEGLEVLTYLSAAAMLALMGRFFGRTGLAVGLSLVVIFANVQVLKGVQFSFLDAPMALGTALFTSSFLATDMLTEFYGAKEARRAVVLGFISLFFVGLWGTLTAASTPSSAHASFFEAHTALKTLFLPMPSFWVASLVAYGAAQMLDVTLYTALKNRTGRAYLWLRVLLSTGIAGFVDLVIFSTLAFQVFAVDPMPWSVLWQTYVLAAYGMRLVFALCGIPTLYFMRKVIT